MSYAELLVGILRIRHVPSCGNLDPVWAATLAEANEGPRS
jgi:hypothetical protein